MRPFRYPVILDTDIGDDIDDTWAIVVMLSSGLFDLRAISVSNYDTEYKARLVCKILSSFGREDIPVFIAPPTPLPNGYRAGQGGWVGDFDLGNYRGKVIREDIPRKLGELIEGAGERVCIFGLGPMASLERVLAAAPGGKERCFCYVMAGSVRRGYGGAAGAAVEFNVGSDVKSARAVLCGGWDVIMLPLDVCATIRMTGKTYRRFLNKESVGASVLRENYAHWIRDEIFGNRNDFGTASSILYDMVVPFYALMPENFDMEESLLEIGDDGMITEGRGYPVRWAKEVRRMEEMLDWTEKIL